MIPLPVRVVESTPLWAGLAVELIDDHIGPGLGPRGQLQIFLDVAEGAGWRSVPIAPVRTPQGAFVYPGLEREADSRNLPPRMYRVRVRADHYDPEYEFNRDGVEVPVHPWDADRAPAVIPPAPLPVRLLPSASYPFAPGVPLLRGVVKDMISRPVARAMVEWKNEKVLTDAKGNFVLPLRTAPEGRLLVIDASDRLQQAGTETVRLPDDLVTEVQIFIF